jgi:hypothetical protein
MEKTETYSVMIKFKVEISYDSNVVHDSNATMKESRLKNLIMERLSKHEVAATQGDLIAINKIKG